jgi:uncharacterized protein
MYRTFRYIELVLGARLPFEKFCDRRAGGAPRFTVLGRAAQISAGIVVKTDLYERAIRTALTLYKGALSPFIGRQGRFTPTCSEYAAQALIEHGPVAGSKLAFGRLCRCRPLAAWGYDPPPPGPRAGERFWKSEG